MVIEMLLFLDLLRGNSTSETVTYYLQVYAGLAMLNSCLTLARAFLFAYAGIKAAHIMHQKLIKTIIYVIKSLTLIR